MNIRVAKKILGYLISDPHVKLSAQTPYDDSQILRASTTMRRSIRRAMAGGGRTRAVPPYREPNGTRQSVKRGRVSR